MLPPSSSSRSLVLTTVALVLAVAFSCWCASLAFSVSKLQTSLDENVARLRGLDGIRDTLLLLDAIIGEDLAKADARPQWNEHYGSCQAILRSAIRGDVPATALGHMRDIDTAMAAMNAAALGLLDLEEQTGSKDEATLLQEMAPLELEFDRAHRAGLAAVGASVIGIRARTSEISALLTRRWRWLYTLAMLSVITVMVLALVYRHAHRDLLALQAAARDLQRGEERFRSVLSATPDVILVIGADGAYRGIYTAEKNLLAGPEDQMLGRSIHDLFAPKEALAFQDIIDRAISTGRRQSFEYPMETGGEQRWFSARVAPYGSPDDPAVLWVARDMTDHMRAEQDLRESEARFRQLAENVQEVFWMMDRNLSRVLYVSPMFEKVWGITDEQVYADPEAWLETIFDEDRPRVVAVFTPQRLEAGDFDVQYRIRRPDGTVRWIHDRAFVVRNAEGRTERFAGIAEDVTERKQAEERLRNTNEELERRVEQRTADLKSANERLRLENVERTRSEEILSNRNKVLERLAAGASLEEILVRLVKTIEAADPKVKSSILVIDETGTKLRLGAAPSLPDFYNRAIEGLAIEDGNGACGTAAATGSRVIIEDALTDPRTAKYQEIIQKTSLRALWSEPIFSSNHEILGTFATYYEQPQAPTAADIEFVKSTAHLAGIAIERRRAEAELRETSARLRVADRLASLGTLTAGLGHDMNNILFPIRCRFNALDWDALPADLKELLSSTRDSVDYLHQLASGLRLLATDSRDDERRTGATTLAAWWPRVRPLISKMVPDRVAIEAHFGAGLPPVGIAAHQLTQAVLNLVINAAEAMPAGGRVLLEAQEQPDGGVAIRVSDEGIGMDDEVRHRIFDPFFTTKTRSLSTGLGLSVVHSLVTMSQGSVSVKSVPGRGTTFELTFPVAGHAATASDRRDTNGSSRATVSLGDKRTAAWVSSVLRSAGYNVQAAAGGDPLDSALWVTEPTAEHLDTARKRAAEADLSIIVLGRGGREWLIPGTVVVEDVGNLEAIRSAVREVTLGER